MEFSSTDEQRAVADLAADLFGAHGSDDHVRRLAESGVTFDAPLWSKLAETGLLNLVLPETCGGSGLGMLELGLVLEQQGRHLAAAPLWQHQLVSLAVDTHGKPELRQRVMPLLSKGEQVAALATELDGHASLQASRTSKGWGLDGRLSAVLLDEVHSWLLVPATTPAGSRLFFIPTNQPGMSRTRGLLTDFQPVCDLAFESALLPGDCDLDPAAASWLEPRIALCISALQLGVLGEALRRAANYVSERHQFGRPLGSFQAIAVRAADAYIEVELLRSAQWQLAWRLDQGLPAASAGRVAKHQASQAGHIVGHTAQHFHGGVGADLQYPVHRFYLKSRALELIGGGAEAQLARIGRDLALRAHEEYIHE